MRDGDGRARIHERHDSGERDGKHAELPDAAESPRTHEAHVEQEEAEHSAEDVAREWRERLAAVLAGEQADDERAAEQENGAVCERIPQQVRP